jgi:hypothetical protein
MTINSHTHDHQDLLSEIRKGTCNTAGGQHALLKFIETGTL